MAIMVIDQRRRRGETTITMINSEFHDQLPQEQLLLPPNVVSLSALVTASAAKHQWLPSMRLLEEMGC